MRKLLLGGLGICALLLAAGRLGHAQSPEEFYRGKTVKFIVGSNTGGSYDTYSRLLAQFMGRHIPGNPTLVVENMPGASGVKSAQYIGEIAPKDGSVFGMFNQSMPQRQMFEPDQVQFDLSKFSWIGAMNTSTTVFITWHASGVKTLEDAKKREVVMGALSATGGNSVYPLLINAFLGGLVVIRAYRQDGIDAFKIGIGNGFQHFVGIVTADAVYNRQPGRVVSFNKGEDLGFLFGRKRGRFSRRAQHNVIVCTLGRMLQKLFQGLVVNLERFGERCDQGNACSVELFHVYRNMG